MVCAGAALAVRPVEVKPLSQTVRRSINVRWVGNKVEARGLNCLQPFGFGTATDGSYVDEPYQNGGTDLEVMPDSRLRLIKSTGFDFVRMCVDPATLTTAANTDRLRKSYRTGDNRNLTSTGCRPIGNR